MTSPILRNYIGWINLLGDFVLSTMSFNIDAKEFDDKREDIQKLLCDGKLCLGII